jgi:energy-coupling factor transport system permease protein
LGIIVATGDDASVRRGSGVIRDASIHALAWLAWLAAILVVLTATRNPLYLGIVLAWIALVTVAVRRTTDAETSAQAVNISPVRFGLFVTALSAVFNGLTVHFGMTILFTLPQQLPLIGGPITLEAIVYGALNGAVIAGLFAAFLVMNRALSVRELVQLIPRAYYPVAVVVSIAITFVPTTLRQFRLIREAQAVRGHRMRGLRSWLPLFIPLLTGGLERALQLSEAMMARGFASVEGESKGAGSRVAIIVGLLLFVAGWLLRLIWDQPWLGLAFLVIGTVMVLGSIWLVGRRHPHTVYRPQSWSGRDWVRGWRRCHHCGCIHDPMAGPGSLIDLLLSLPAAHGSHIFVDLGHGNVGVDRAALVIMRDSLDAPRQADAESKGGVSSNSEETDIAEIDWRADRRKGGGQVPVSSL